MEKTIEFLLSYVRTTQKPRPFRDRCCQLRLTNDTDAIPSVLLVVIGLPSVIDRSRPENSRALFNTFFWATVFSYHTLKSNLDGVPTSTIISFPLSTYYLLLPYLFQNCWWRYTTKLFLVFGKQNDTLSFCIVSVLKTLGNTGDSEEKNRKHMNAYCRVVFEAAF